MSTKSITITEAAYARLASKKAPKESFSEVVLRLTGTVRLSDFAGTLSKETAMRIEDRIRNLRARSRNRAQEIRGRL